MHVVLAGGGTAGHVEPALAVADALRALDAEVGLTVLGTERGLEGRLVPERGYPLALIPPVPLPRRITPALLAVPPRLAAAVRASAAVLDRTGADVVMGFGGYVALPAYLAARRRRLPIVVHEANAIPGLANRIGARLTCHVATGTPATRLPHARYVGIPMRPAIARLDRAAVRRIARSGFGLEPDLPTLLVFGGSQGARRVNDAAVGAAAALAAAGIQVLHATGAAHIDAVSAGLDARLSPPPTAPPSARPPAPHSTWRVSRTPAGGDAPYVALPYLDRMDLAYAAADLALCRAGALTCAELAAVGLPAAYVPLAIGNGEQRRNAEPVVAAGGGLLVQDAQLDAAWVGERLVPLLEDRPRLAAMAAAASGVGRRDADVTLAAMALAAGRGS